MDLHWWASLECLRQEAFLMILSRAGEMTRNIRESASEGAIPELEEKQGNQIRLENEKKGISGKRWRKCGFSGGLVAVADLISLSLARARALDFCWVDDYSIGLRTLEIWKYVTGFFWKAGWLNPNKQWRANARSVTDSRLRNVEHTWHTAVVGSRYYPNYSFDFFLTTCLSILSWYESFNFTVRHVTLLILKYLDLSLIAAKYAHERSSIAPW